MVVSGYSDFDKQGKGPTNDIEIISGENNRACSKSVAPFGNSFRDPETGEILKEGAVIGLTGQFTKEVPIVCGGKNVFDNLNSCWEYDLTTNLWLQNPPMLEKRYRGESVLDLKGDLWVLGGTYDSTSSDSTEIYEFDYQGQGKWINGQPLPGILRDTGLESFCAVRVNSSHIFIAGGYARGYRAVDSLACSNSQNEDEDQVDIQLEANPRVAGKEGEGLPSINKCNKDELDGSEDSIQQGGYVLNKAWMFDGNDWKELGDMSQRRDRPACSLVQDQDEGVIIRSCLHLW